MERLAARLVMLVAGNDDGRFATGPSEDAGASELLGALDVESIVI